MGGLSPLCLYGRSVFRHSLTNNKESKMEKVAVTLQVGKESKEVADCMSGILADVKAGKGVAEIAAGNLTKLFAAVEGFDKLDDEFKDDKAAVAAYLVHELMKSLEV